MCDISAPHLPNGSSTSVLFFEGVAKGEACFYIASAIHVHVLTIRTGIVYLEARRHRRIFPGGILSACSALLALTLLYVVSKIIYRLYFSPLATFPGPKFAAATKLFEAWHVIVKDDWLENLCALHDKYGMMGFISKSFIPFPVQRLLTRSLTPQVPLSASDRTNSISPTTNSASSTMEEGTWTNAAHTTAL
jgi:hypothetical protein